MQTEARNATLADLSALLIEQQSRKLDVVAPATAIRSRGGVLTLAGTDAVLTDDGVTITDGAYRPTATADEGIASKLGIPVGFLKRLRADRPDLYDRNVNGLLRGLNRYDGNGTIASVYPADTRSFLIRCFTGDDGGEGICRAFLSDSYRTLDNLDVLTAALDGIRSAGAEVTVQACDLTERRMYVRIYSDDVAVHAPALLDGYRSPFTGNLGADNPIVHAGFILSNSEVGGGAWSITPRLLIEVCENGMTITKDAMRAVHLGAKLDHGIVKASAETEEKNLALITSQARDAVATFLDRDYVARKIDEVTGAAQVRVVDAAATVEKVASRLKFSDEVRAGVLDHFIRGGQLTAGGVMHAVTSFAQEVGDADAAQALEDVAFDALAAAATIAG